MKINLSKIKPMQGIHICPVCGGKTEYAGISSGHIFPALHTGQMYVCSECGYQGSFIIEVDGPDDVRKMKEALHEHSEDTEKSTFSFPEKWIWFWKVILYIFLAGLLIIIIVFASLGAYYLYLNKQKDAMQIEESGKSDGYRLYRIEPDAIWSWGNPYYIDSIGDTTGHPISKDTYEAIQFFRNKEEGKVLSWWDFELEIKAAGKEPVIRYASNAIKMTIARPASLYDKYESDEKVADVAKFFTTDSEESAKSIAQKYGAEFVYIPKERIRGIFSVLVMAANPDINFQTLSNIGSSEGFYETSMAHKFNSGAELKYFDKIFENNDVIIYQLK